MRIRGWKALVLIELLKLKKPGKYILELKNGIININEQPRRGTGRALARAHIYKNKENGKLLYCSAKQRSHNGFKYLGTARVPKRDIVDCYLS